MAGTRNMIIGGNGSVVARPNSNNISVAKSGGTLGNTASMMNTRCGELSKANDEHLNRNKK